MGARVASILGRVVSLITFIAFTSLAYGQESNQASDRTAAGNWEIEQITVRARDGNSGKLSLALYESARSPSKIVLVPSPSTKPNVSNGKLNSFSPWVRAAALLSDRGIEVVYVDVPSDANGRNAFQRQIDIARDLNEAGQYMRAKFPAASVSIGAYQDTGIAALNFLKNGGAADKAIIVSGNFSNGRTENWGSLSRRATLVHVPSAKCSIGPFFEAQWIAQLNHLRLVQANYAKTETVMSCKSGSQVTLAGLEAPFAELVADLLADAQVPAAIGDSQAEIAWHEEVLTYAIPSDGVHIEMTLLFPDGKGPFPVVVFNHGDIEMDSAYIRYKQRFRDMTVAAEFLGKGIAVAFPARRGVGMSEGIYRLSGSRFDGDPLYTARRHAIDILPAFDALRNRPEIDASRMIVSGQSAGGYSTMYIASLNLPGVIGAINFSGGRTDSWGGNGASNLVTTMISGFEEAGKTTKVPMLWIFAEQDSRYPVATINACYEAFTRSGGKATLFISPPTGHDGHYVYHSPDLWRDKLQVYLVSAGLMNQ